MNYFAIKINDDIIGFVTEESQKAFLLECDPNHKFYQFTWDKENPPMPEDISIVNEQVVINE